MPKVQIVILCINLWDKYTKPCIDSVKTKYEHRLLLIDNGSTDATQLEATKLISPTFGYIRNEERKAVAESWNIGVKDAFNNGYDYVFILNNDTLLHPEAIDRLLERFEWENNELAAARKDGDKEMVMATCLDVTGESGIPNGIFGLSIEPKLACPESEHPCFSGFMINRFCWDRVGQFDENFKPAYYEDNDYHYRINLAGLKAIVVPTSMFYHYGSRTNAEAFDKPFIDSSPNHMYYREKWGGDPTLETYKTPFNK
jgi:GT2 family glycosyltransferase